MAYTETLLIRLTQEEKQPLDRLAAARGHRGQRSALIRTWIQNHTPCESPNSWSQD